MTFTMGSRYRAVTWLPYCPSLAKRYSWSSLDSNDWCFFLTNGGPEMFRFAEKCDWSKFGIGEWIWLLAKCPEFADKCDWDMMNKECSDWDYLLSEQPQLAKYRKLWGAPHPTAPAASTAQPESMRSERILLCL